MLAVSSRIGPYEIIAPLGAGGMGEVYRARDTRLGREVAVKVLPEPFANNPDCLARFEREARAVAALSHPNILSIHDYGTCEGTTYAVMELLEGETLRSRLTKGPLPWREAIEIGAAIAEGLAAAHVKGIVHRDLKPENLFLTEDGRLKILDFGLARVMPVGNSQSETSPYVLAVTNPGTVLGTVGYMSPEQVRSQTADARSDIFSFGCVLYEMVTGRRAFLHETTAETMTAILREEPAEATESGNQVPVELGRVIRHCLAKNPNQRLQSAHDLALGLRAAASDPRIQPLASSPSAREFDHVKTLEALAVLPFEIISGDPKTEYLSDGLADHLIISLSQVRRDGIKVRPFSSVSRYKRQRADLPTIGRELNVHMIVTGTLHQLGDELWVSVAVVDALEDNQLWGKRYQGKLGGILDLQDQITRDVAANLALKLTSEEQQRLTKRYTEDPEAYLLYREANYHWNKFTEEGLRTAIEYCQRALKKDPNYALAYAQLGRCYTLWGSLHQGPRKTFPEARSYLSKALTIDQTLPDAHAGMGIIYLMHDWDWPAAERELKQAAPSDPSRAVYGFYLAAMGRPADALPVIRQLQELDPLAAPHVNEVAMCYNWLRQYDQAIAEAQKALELDPHFPLAYAELGTAYVQKGMPEAAIDELHKAIKLGQRHPRVAGTLGYAYAAAGKRAEAQRVLEELKGVAQGRFGFALPIARIHAALGAKDPAFAWLRKACDERDPHVIWLKVDPTLDSLRSDPRFAQVLRDMGLPLDTRSTHPPPPDRGPSRLLAWGLAALVLAGFIGTAVYFLTRGGNRLTADKPAAEPKAVEALAVLPFKNVGGDAKAEFLSDGVADQIINSLSQVRRHGLKVRPFTSVARYKGKEPDVPTFGRELNVQMIVTGTLLQQGDDLTVRVALVDVRDDNQIWGHSYRGKRDSILDLQDQIARDVAANLHLRLTGEEDRRLTKRYTEDPEAYLFYREGLYHWNKFTEEGLKTAIEYYERAVKKDPNYALGYVGLAHCYILSGALYRGPRATFPEARKHLTNALAIDDTLSDAHTVLGLIYMFHDWDWPAAERELKLAVAPDPSSATTLSRYGFYLAAMGRPSEALVYTQRNIDLDPLAARTRNEFAMCLNWLRRYDQAIVASQKTLELDPNFPLAYAELGTAYVQKGMVEEAIAELNKALNRGHKHPRVWGMLGCAYAAAGRRTEANKVLEDLKGLSQGRFAFAFPIARIHAALGARDQAFEGLRKACYERDSGVIWLKVDPTMDSLRSDPRFAQVLKDMGLPP